MSVNNIIMSLNNIIDEYIEEDIINQEEYMRGKGQHIIKKEHMGVRRQYIIEEEHIKKEEEHMTKEDVHHYSYKLLKYSDKKERFIKYTDYKSYDCFLPYYENNLFFIKGNYIYNFCLLRFNHHRYMNFYYFYFEYEYLDNIIYNGIKNYTILNDDLLYSYLLYLSILTKFNKYNNFSEINQVFTKVMSEIYRDTKLMKTVIEIKDFIIKTFKDDFIINAIISYLI